MNKVKASLLGTLTGIASVLCMPSAEAVMMLSISDGSNSVAITDNDASDGSSAVGLIQYLGSVGVFNFVFNVGISKPFLGDVSEAKLHLTASVLSSSGSTYSFPSTLTIMLTDTDFDRAVGNSNSVSSVGGVANGDVSFESYYDNGNTAFGTSNLLSSFSFGAGSFSGTQSDPVFTTNPYSLTLVAHVTHTGGNQNTSLDYELKVPEPGTIALLGIGLMGIGFATYRQNKRA